MADAPDLGSGLKRVRVQISPLASWKIGRVVYGGGLENRWPERVPGFESLIFLVHPKQKEQIMSDREIKPKQIRVTDTRTGESLYFRGFYKKDAEDAVISGRFKTEFLTADEFFVDLQAGKVANVIDLTAPAVEAPVAQEEEEGTPAE